MSSKIMDIAEDLQYLFSLDINEVDLEIDRLAWDSALQSQDFLSFVNCEKIPHDLRGIAAGLYIQSLYPQTPFDNGSPRTQTRVNLPEELRGAVSELASTAPVLVCLGMIEGFDRVSEFDEVRRLFSNHHDPVVNQSAASLLDELN